MTISTTSDRISYVGDSSTVTFPFPYYFVDAAHIFCIRTTIATQVNLVLVQGTDFTVAGAGVLAGGSVTTIGALSPLTSAYTLLILRVVPLTQLDDWIAHDQFRAETLEKNLDLSTMALQQLDARIGILETTGPIGALTLANVGTGAGTIFRDQVSSIYNLKTVKAGTGISITNNADDVTINNTGSAISYPGTTNQFLRGDGNFSDVTTEAQRVTRVAAGSMHLWRNSAAGADAKQWGLDINGSAGLDLQTFTDAGAPATLVWRVTRSGTAAPAMSFSPRILLNAVTDDGTTPLQVSGTARFTTALPFSSGGTGQTTRQAAINALTDAAAASTGQVLSRNSAGNALFVNPTTAIYNVKDYGAVGDGATDDATAINAADTAAFNAGGGTVFFPPGNYLVNSTITVAPNVTFQGPLAGTFTVNHAAKIVGANTLTPVVDLDGGAGNQSAGIRGLGITRNGSAPASSIGLNIRRTDWPTLEDIHVWNHAIPVDVDSTLGINFHRLVTDVASECHVRLNGAVENNFSNCRFGNNGGQGIACGSYIKINSNAVDSVSFTRCNFTQSGVNVTNAIDVTTHNNANGIINFVSCIAEAFNTSFLRMNDASGLTKRVKLVGTVVNGSGAQSLLGANISKLQSFIAANCTFEGMTATFDGIVPCLVTGNYFSGNVTINAGDTRFTGNSVTGTLTLSGVATQLIATGNYVSGAITDTMTGPRIIKGNNFAGNVLAQTATKSADYTATFSDEVIFIDASGANRTITLPAANAMGATLSPRIIVIRKDASANTVTVQRAGSDTFVGGGTSTTIPPTGAKTFDADGASLWGVY
jgi:hypothetical protein